MRRIQPVPSVSKQGYQRMSLRHACTLPLVRQCLQKATGAARISLTSALTLICFFAPIALCKVSKWRALPALACTLKTNYSVAGCWWIRSASWIARLRDLSLRSVHKVQGKGVEEWEWVAPSPADLHHPVEATHQELNGHVLQILCLDGTERILLGCVWFKAMWGYLSLRECSLVYSDTSFGSSESSCIYYTEVKKNTPLQ